MVRRIINVILIIVLLFSMYKIAEKLLEYKKGQDLYGEIAQIKEERIDTEEEITPLDLSDINEDYVSWLYVNDTNIDYPIVQGEDNDYYLYRDINEEYLAAGSIFMDFRNDGFEGLNTILFGHNMRDDSMFGTIDKFKDKSFAEENNIEIITKTGEVLEYEVFSVYVTNPSINYIQTNFTDEVEYGMFINKLENDSIIDFDVEIGPTDKIITLSTCSYEFDDARTVVHGRLIEDETSEQEPVQQESTEEPTSEAEAADENLTSETEVTE